MTDRIGWRRGAAAAVLLAVVAAMAGCSAGGSDDAGVETTSDAGGAADQPAAPEVIEEPATDDAGDGERAADEDTAGPPGGGTSVVAATLGRRVIRTATLELEDADPGAVADRITQVTERAGGFVATADLHRDEDGVLSGTMTVRVPSGSLEGLLDELEGTADRAPLRRIDEQDVTVEATDLEAQLTNLTAYERELRTLLRDVRERTERPEDLLTVYERVREVRAEIDRLQARLSVLEDQVALSTITITLTPTVEGMPVADPTWDPGATVREALTAAARALSGVADAAIWVALAILPVLLVLALPVGGAVLLLRRFRRRPDATGGTPPSAPPPVTAP